MTSATPPAPATLPPRGLWRLKLSLFLNFFLIAGLLNSVGTVILQVQRNFGVSEPAASTLEACKDLSIAVVSFFVAAWLLRIGYKRAMLGALAFLAVLCMAMPSVPSFLATQLLFVAIGASFAILKVSVFSTLGLIASEPHAHASMMSFLEACFMCGILVAYFLFSAFVDNDAPASTSWFRVYYVLGAVAIVAFILLLSAPLDESSVRTAQAAQPGATTGILPMLRLLLTPIVLVFVASIFIYVLLEQAIMSWLPTFNHTVLHLPPALSIQMTSILAASTALGRFLSGWFLKRLSWLTVLLSCLGATAALILLALPLAAGAHATPVTGWGNAPLAAFLFPMIGLFLAPIYPTLNSIALSALPPVRHSAMSGIIVIFSALGGTTGSLITGRLFQLYGGKTAFYLALVPLAALILCLLAMRKLRRRATTATDAPSA